MVLNKRHKNSMYSLILLCVLGLIVYVLIKDSVKLEVAFVFAIQFIALGFGSLYVILRLLRFTIRQTNFFYNYFGMLNIVMPIPLFLIGFANWMMLLHLIIGVIILFDIYFDVPLGTE